MMTGVKDNMLLRFSEFVREKTALNFPVNRLSDLESRAGAAAGEFGFNDVEKFIQWLISAPVSREQVEMLASHLTVNETYFWREPLVFDALLRHVLPEIIHRRKGNDKLLRIWSAGCSTGEEPYSIAMAVRSVVPDPDKWNITILATDINPRMLGKAAEGIYREWSFRNTPQWLREKFFVRRDDGRLEVLPEIRRMVSFFYLNLAEDIYPSPLNNTGAMDIVFCRNVLMYFANDQVRSVVRGLNRSLVAGGWLVVSSSELSLSIFKDFTTVNFPGAIMYRKEAYPPRGSAGIHITGFDIPPEIIKPAAVSTPENEVPDTPYLFPGIGVTGEEGRDDSERNGPGDRVAENDDETEAAGLPADDTGSAVIGEVRARADTGDLGAALTLCDAAIAGNRLNAALYYLKAVILQEQNRFDEACASLRHTLYLEPDHPMACFTMGNISLREGDMKGAKRWFNNALLLMNDYDNDDIVPESDGLTAGRFGEIVRALLKTGALL